MLVVGLVAVLACAVWFRNELVAPLALRVAHGPLERATGLDVAVERFAGSWLRGIELEGLHVRAASAEVALRELRAERVALRYDLLRLVRGGAAGLTAIEASDVALELDLTRGAGGAPPAADGSPSFVWPARLPRVTLADVELDLRLGPDAELTLAGFALAADGAPRWAIEAAARELVLHADGERYAVATPALRGALEDGRFELALDVLSRPLTAAGTLTTADDGTARVAVRLALDGADVAHDAELIGALCGLSLAEDAWSGRWSLAVALDAPLSAPLAGTGEVALAGAGLVLDGIAIESCDASARLAAGRLADGTLELATAANRLTLSGFETPLEAPDLAARLVATRAALEVELTDVPALVATLGARLGARADDAAADPEAALGAHRVVLSARLADGVLSIDDGALEYAGGHADVRRGSLPLSIAAERLSADALDVELDVALRDIEALGALVRQDGWHGSLAGEVVLQGTLAAPRGHVRLTGRDLSFADLALGELTLAATADGAAFVLERLALDGPLGRLDATGQHDLAARRIGALHATGRSGPAFADAAPALAQLAGGELAFELALASPSGASGPSNDGALALDAAWSAPELAGWLVGRVLPGDPVRVTLDEASLAFGGAHGDTLTLLRPVEIALGTVIAVEDLSLASQGGGTLHGSFASAERSLVIDAELADFAPPAALTSRLPSGCVVGPLSGHVHIDRAADELSADIALQPVDVHCAGWPAARLALTGGARAGRIELARLSLAGAGFALELAGSLPFDPARPRELPDGPLAAHGTLRIDDLAAFVAPLDLPDAVRLEGGALGVRIALEGTSAAPRGGVSLDAHELALVLGRHESARRFVATTAAELELRPSSIQLVRGSLALDGDALIGTFAGSLARPLDLTALGAGTWDARDAALTARAALDARDLAALAPLSDTIRRLSGAARLEVELAGTPAAPQPRGTLHIEHGALRTSTALPAIAELEARLALTPAGVEVSGVTGELGGAPFRLDGSLVPWGDEPSVALSFHGENLLLYRLDGVRVRADGELMLSGALRAPTVKGSVALRDGRYVKDIQILSSSRLSGGPDLPGKSRRGLQLFTLAPPLDAITFDLDLRSATPFEIDNNLTQGAVRPELHLTGTGAVPIPSGTIYIDPTRVSLPSGTLWVRSGTLRFTDADPFLPTLEITGEMRLYGYDVRLSITGPYDQPDVEISSVPTLANEKLLLMVLTGARPDADGDVGSTAQDVAVYLAKDILARFSDDTSTAESESLLDRVEVVVGGDVTRSGAQTTRGSLRIADDVLRDQDQLFLTGEKDVYDKVNFGVRILFRFP